MGEFRLMKVRYLKGPAAGRVTVMKEPVAATLEKRGELVIVVENRSHVVNGLKGGRS